MDIVFLGHSAFRIRGKDVTLVTDPYAPSDGTSMGSLEADIVTVSGPGETRDSVTAVGGNPRTIAGPGEYEVGGVLVHGVATSAEPMVGPTNTAYVFRLDDVVVCHLGAVRSALTDAQIEEIGSIDVVMVPAGEGSSLGPDVAARVVAQLSPQVVLPMEFTLGDGGAGAEPIDRFRSEMGAKSIEPEQRLSLTRGSLPSETRVVLLEPHKA